MFMNLGDKCIRAIEDALVLRWLDHKFDDPIQALKDIQAWDESVLKDPAVSKYAARFHKMQSFLMELGVLHNIN